MYPVLIKLDHLHIYSYGILLTLGWLIGTIIAVKYSGRFGVRSEIVWNCSIIALSSGIIGGRLAYIFTHQSQLCNIRNIINFWRDGLMFHGSLGAITIAILCFAYYNHCSLPGLADCAALALGIAQVVGRMGCFLAGCCYGKPCTYPWAVHFNNPEAFLPAEFKGVPLHPAQLYSSASALAVICILLWKSRKSVTILPGEIALSYLFAISIARIAEEFFRGDIQNYLFYQFSLTQFVATIITVLSAIGLYWLRQKSRGDILRKKYTTTG